MDSEDLTYNYDEINKSAPYEEASKTTALFSTEMLNEKSISILGFELHFDDILILAVILFLFQEEKKDYILIGILALMFFDFSIDKLSTLEPLKRLISSIT